MQKIQLSLALVIVATLFGCDSTPRLKGLVPASGTVTHNGTPVEGALVMFAPVAAGPNVRAASATTGANGKFTLMTLQHADGAYPGNYKITVTKTETTGEFRQEGTVEEGNARLIDTRMIADLLPQKYRSVDTSELTVEIPSKGDKKIVLELSGEVDSTPRKLAREPR